MKRFVTPKFVKPMTATLVQALPEGERWLYEVKLQACSRQCRFRNC